MARNCRISSFFFLLLMLCTTSHCEARALRQSKRNSLMNVLFKLNFARAATTVARSTLYEAADR
ncbi:hypothetical protein TRIUR3_20377 [Triticum urartu]|uniref:Uncharacterized protein n=1 Tax=Triticum urartu TaxID=4572 RepID=M8A598_TRIUA|nr:hypothetical protein TRIUR3_20377 [Triticum urartu]